jgi:serine/threonine protein kinase
MGKLPPQIGNYILDKQIGLGASSEVWLAHHHHLPQRKVAIKVLMAYDDDSHARFQREASIASRLRHPNIVELFDYGQYHPFYCTIYQYIEGSSLDSFIKRHGGGVELDHALSIFRDTAQALDYAHSLDVVHRDVSPGNILLEDSTGRAYLTDFGIAREPKNPSLTLHDAIMGTPGFWSPEHLQSARSVTRHSDIFSLGVVWYYTLCGKMPWDEIPDMPSSVFQPPMSLRQRGAKYAPVVLDRVFQSMLAVDPIKRYTSAQAAFEEIERILVRHSKKTEIMSKEAVAGLIDDNDLLEELVSDPVENALGPDCIRDPLIKAQERANELAKPEKITTLLNDWSKEGRLRRPNLGRLANLHGVENRNIYFYELQLLFEQRDEPTAIYEPDLEGKDLPLEREPKLWHIKLSPPKHVTDERSGDEVIPGSLRVVSCSVCEGMGRATCTYCKGARRVNITRPIETDSLSKTVGGGQASNATSGIAATSADNLHMENALVACPQCKGVGGFDCESCQATGRLLERKIFHWTRTAWSGLGRDQLKNERHEAVLALCEPEVIYREEGIDGIRPEWEMVPMLNALINQAKEEAPEGARIVRGHLLVKFVPSTDIIFDIGESDKRSPSGVREHILTAYGFENYIPKDWTFLNWDRIWLYFGGGFLLLITIFSYLVAYFT